MIYFSEKKKNITDGSVDVFGPGYHAKKQRLSMDHMATFLDPKKFDIQLSGLAEELRLLKKRRNSLIRKYHTIDDDFRASKIHEDILGCETSIETMRQTQWTIHQVKRFLSRLDFVDTSSKRLSKLNLEHFIQACSHTNSWIFINLWDYISQKQSDLANMTETQKISAWFSGTLKRV
jgi:hypothetical protein